MDRIVKLVESIEGCAAHIAELPHDPGFPELEGCPLRVDENGRVKWPMNVYFDVLSPCYCVSCIEWLEKLEKFYSQEYERLELEARESEMDRAEAICEWAREAPYFGREDK